MAGYSHCRCADYRPAASRTPAVWARICRARLLESAPCPEREEPPACRRRMQVVQWSKVSSYVPLGQRFQRQVLSWVLLPLAGIISIGENVHNEMQGAIADCNCYRGLGTSQELVVRSEERRVGKEGRGGR